MTKFLGKNSRSVLMNFHYPLKLLKMKRLGIEVGLKHGESFLFLVPGINSKN